MKKTSITPKKDNIVTIKNEFLRGCKYFVWSKFIPKTPDTYAPKPIPQDNTVKAVLAINNSLREVSNRKETISSAL